MAMLIGLIDDHIIMRQGLKRLIESDHRFKVVLESSNGIEFFQELNSMKLWPDILIIDISMPLMDGYSILEKINKEYPGIKVIVFSMLTAEDAILNAINKGANAFLFKSTDPEELFTAIDAVFKNGFYHSNHLKTSKKNEETRKKKGGFHGKQILTEKEIQFIRLAATNLTYKEIAVVMNVQPKTVENYRDSLFQKLSLNNRTALTVYGIQNGIIQLL